MFDEEARRPLPATRVAVLRAARNPIHLRPSVAQASITSQELHHELCLRSRNTSHLTTDQLAEAKSAVRMLPVGSVLHVQACHA